eukprot:c31747_g1_i1 orf=107-325(+)
MLTGLTQSVRLFFPAGRCYGCGSTEHIARFCHARKKEKGSSIKKQWKAKEKGNMEVDSREVYAPLVTTDKEI